MKVILLAFANSKESPLPNLLIEEKIVHELLSERASRGDYFIPPEPLNTIEEINNALEKYKEDLAIFHFSGHAGKDKLFINDEHAFSKGIASQLNYSAEKGVLELVILNGCSTYGQIKTLKSKKVPVVVSTNAPVEDRSAKEFSIRFWKNLIKYHMSIEQAFSDALGPAETLTKQDLSKAYHRHLFTENEAIENDDLGVWRLDTITDDYIKRNPVPYNGTEEVGEKPEPNDELIETLFESLNEAENPEIKFLWESEKIRNQAVSKSKKTSDCLNNIPYPIGIHLQRLLSPQLPSLGEAARETTNTFGMARLKQIAQLYHTTTEFLCIVMIAQLWELKVKLKDAFVIEPLLEENLNNYIDLDEESRKTYNHLPLIQLIRSNLENNNRDGNNKPFIDEQDYLKQVFETNEKFKQACEYLHNLRKQTVNNRLDTTRIKLISYEAEKNLCQFMRPLGFVHRYNLVSVQKIDILKLRRTTREDGDFLHRVVRCMQSTGKDEYSYYYMKDFVDNWSVMLIKTRIEKILDNRKKKFKVIQEDYLNLSPFIIDKNSFDEKADLPNIMFFKSISKQKPGIFYQFVQNPLNPRDEFEVKDEDAYEPIRLQFEAFRKIIQSNKIPA